MALRDSLAAVVSWRQLPREGGVTEFDLTTCDGLVTEEFRLGGIPATLIRPEGAGPFPAVLYAHAHGLNYAQGRRELIDGARWSLQPLGPVLARAGFVALTVDMPCFGDRQERAESALSKALLWQGRTLWAEMLADLAMAFDHLSGRSDVDPARVLTFGMSMGAAHAFWLGAMETRVAGVVQLCMMAEIAALIETGAHDLHAPYLTVPGLLNLADMGDVAALVAPRPQFIAHGTEDALTPPPARDPALAKVRAAYGDGPLTTFLAEGSGHCETLEMHVAMMSFLSRFAG